MTHDAEAKRGGYSAKSYLKVLDEQIPIYYKLGRTFMQDNASIHTVKKVKSQFKDQGIPLLDWPPYSPDINPIEHLWAKMKQWIIKQHPKLSFMRDTKEARAAMARAIIKA